jgi:hypothetical protein
MDVLVDVFVVLAWIALGVWIGWLLKPNRPDPESDAEALRDLVSHYRADLDNAVEVNRALQEQRDQARAEREASDRLAVDFLELLEAAEEKLAAVHGGESS